MQPFGDLTPPSREFIIAMIEELEQDKYATKGKFSAVWHGVQDRWSLTADGRPVDLSVPVDTGMLAELERLAYVLFVARSLVLRDYTVLQKAHDEYKLYVEPPTSTETLSEDHDFSFIANPELRSIIERDYQEIPRCLAAEAFKAATVMCGSVMEALLLDALLADEPKAKESAEALTAKGGKVPKDLGKWSLRLMIAVAQDLQILPAAILGMSDPIREYRNLIHPAVEMRKKIAPEREEARAAQTALDVIIKNLARAECGQCKSA